MNRKDSARIAALRAADFGLESRGLTCASELSVRRMRRSRRPTPAARGDPAGRLGPRRRGDRRRRRTRPGDRCSPASACSGTSACAPPSALAMVSLAKVQPPPAASISAITPRAPGRPSRGAGPTGDRRVARRLGVRAGLGRARDRLGSSRPAGQELLDQPAQRRPLRTGRPPCKDGRLAHPVEAECLAGRVIEPRLGSGQLEASARSTRSAAVVSGWRAAAWRASASGAPASISSAHTPGDPSLLHRRQDGGRQLAQPGAVACHQGGHVARRAPGQPGRPAHRSAAGRAPSADGRRLPSSAATASQMAAPPWPPHSPRSAPGRRPPPPASAGAGARPQRLMMSLATTVAMMSRRRR